MDITPFYELRNRLYSTALAGCSVIAEDFRLKRAVENFKALSEVNKPFAKLYNMCIKLFESENASYEIAECIALADALAVVQGTFADSSETNSYELDLNLKPVNIYYSRMSNLLNHMPNVQEIFNNSKSSKLIDFIKDPRFLSCFIKNMNKVVNNQSFDELVNIVFRKYEKNIIPLLKNSLDVSNPKSHGKQVKYVADMAKDSENEWYLELAENENLSPEIRVNAIEALRFDYKNSDKLMELYSTQKGKIKNAVIASLAVLDPPDAEPIWKKMTENVEKFKKAHSKFISLSKNKIFTDFAIKFIYDDIEKLSKMNKNEYARCNIYFSEDIEMLANKTGPEVEECFIKTSEFIKNFKFFSSDSGISNALQYILINNLLRHSEPEYREIIRNLFNKDNDTFFKANFYLNLYESPDTAFDNLNKLSILQRNSIIEILSNIWYSYSEKKYYINTEFSLSRINAIPIFKEVPESLFELISDTSFMEKTLFINSDKKMLCNNIYRRLNFILQHSNWSDKDMKRLKKITADFVFATIHKIPEISGIYLFEYIEDEEPEKYKNIALDIISHMLKEKSSYFATQIQTVLSTFSQFPLSDDDKISELSKIKDIYVKSLNKTLNLHEKYVLNYIDSFISNLKK